MAIGETTQWRKCLLHKCEDKNSNPCTHKRARKAWHPAHNLYPSIQEVEAGHLRHKLAIKTHQIKVSDSMRDTVIEDTQGQPRAYTHLHNLTPMCSHHTNAHIPHAHIYKTTNSLSQNAVTHCLCFSLNISAYVCTCMHCYCIHYISLPC